MKKKKEDPHPPTAWRRRAPPSPASGRGVRSSAPSRARRLTSLLWRPPPHRS